MNTKPTPRRITLNLTDGEVKDLTAFAIRGGVTVGTLLEDFVADLTYSTRSGGSDEEDRARAWYDRRGYQYGEGRSFSAYLAEYDDARRFFSALEDYEDLTGERDYLTAHPEEAEPGELEAVTDDAIIAREALEEYLSDYRKAERGTEATLETIIADAKAHIKELTNHGRSALESEPTEGGPRNTADFSPATVGTLKRLEEETYSAYGVNSKPPGFTWINMALDIAWKITNEPGLLDTITEADLDKLTEENFHTARHAAEVALHLKKYII